MSHSIQIIQMQNLALAFTPALVVVWIMYRWSLNGGDALYALARMILQLLGIGYVLVYIFALSNPAIILMLLTLMLWGSRSIRVPLVSASTACLVAQYTFPFWYTSLPAVEPMLMMWPLVSFSKGMQAFVM